MAIFSNKNKRLLIGIVLMGTLSVIYGQGADIQVTIEEEKDPGTLVTRVTDYPNVYSAGNDPSKVTKISYVILEQNSVPFEIGPDTGVITVSKKLDRETLCDRTEKLCQVTFIVNIETQALNGSVYTDVPTVAVFIDDINDNPPRFPAKQVTININEAAKKGYEQKIAGAVDPDTKPEYTVQFYNMTPKLDEFSIRPDPNPDGSSSIILKLEKDLDREKKDQYVFNIMAYDGDKQPQSDFFKVTVKVEDANDNTPQFNRDEYELTIKEDAIQGSIVGKVTASDIDEGANGDITYSFSTNSASLVRGIFSINSTTGEITLEGNLNEIKRTGVTFSMYVDATDKGNPPRSNQTLVTAVIIDTGNNAPTIRISTINVNAPTVSEDKGPGSFVAYVYADDSDLGKSGEVDCFLTTGNDFKLTRPNKKRPNEYTLVLNTKVDRDESKSVYEVGITCRDNASPPLQTSKTMNVTITDVNDNDPAFVRPKYFSNVRENGNGGVLVAQVYARDIDAGDNAKISYSLSKEVQNIFSVNSNGVISTTGSLDREANATISFEVFAVDHGNPPRTGMAEVYVTVEDANDNSPTFNREKYTFFVSESIKNGTIIGNLVATDKDIGKNGMFHFQISTVIIGEMPLPVTVLQNGSVQVTGKLDHEDEDYLSFKVMVRDYGDQARSNYATVEVKVKDENDNSPVILFPTSNNHTIVISTYPENDMVLGTIIAHDLDAVVSAKLHYAIYHGNDDGAFAMTPEDGELILKDMKRLKNPKEYLLSIVVRDSGEIPRNATTQLKVDVNFANKTMIEPPVEERSQYVIIVGVIGGATVVLSAIIISAIIIIFRSEKNKGAGKTEPFISNKYFSNSPAESQFMNKQIPKPDVTMSNSDSINSDSATLILNPGNLSKKPEDVQKKVSFSFDVPEDVQGQGFGGDKQIRFPSASPGDANSWKRSNHNEDVHDVHSDTSGESVTCDSGRGTSDEDIKFDHSPLKALHMNAPCEPMIPSRDRSYDPLLSNTSNSQQAHMSQPNYNQSQPIKHNQNFQPGVNHKHGFLGPKTSGYSMNRLPPPSIPSSASSSRNNRQRVHNSYKDNLMNPDILRPSSALSFTHQGSVMSMDDDASTTTSGSYVINPDDIRLEGMMGKDVIV